MLVTGINSFQYRISMERFEAWEYNRKLKKPRRSIHECRKARRKLKVFNKPEHYATRKSKSFFILQQPKKSGLLNRTRSCPDLHEKISFLQDNQETNFIKQTSSKTLFSTSESSISGRKFAILRPTPRRSKSCCCSEHLILQLNLKYFNENSRAARLNNLYSDFENLEGFAKRKEIKPKKSQSLIFLPVCDPVCMKKQHQVTGDKSSFVKRVKHFICCCVRRSISQSNLEMFTEPLPANPA
ncbi:hypothetical protein ILUMI_25310 [Ignelater luminosus]|uniref:Uncharacterized protein n=1 Tax=Ignelater luminosus TaxID=2038154 RepID=A0A8K0C4X9_IGNLU|nr:hypothetical protein ILUMI_25310 [Ignelater luminosus]